MLTAQRYLLHISLYTTNKSEYVCRFLYVDLNVELCAQLLPSLFAEKTDLMFVNSIEVRNNFCAPAIS